MKSGIFRWFGKVMNVRVHGSAAVIDIGGKSVFINVAAGNLVESVYKALEGFEDVRVESLEGVKIGMSTDFAELQGSAFYVKVEGMTFKITSDHLAAPLEMHKFLFESERVGLESYLFMHEYLSKLSKVTTAQPKYNKDHLSSIIDHSCPSHSSLHSKSPTEIHTETLQIFQELQKMHPTFLQLHSQAEKSANTLLWGGFAVTLLQFLYITSGSYYFACWDVMEAKAYLIGLGNTLFGISAYVYYQLEPHQRSFHLQFYEKTLKSESAKQNFDLKRYNSLKSQLQDLQSLITAEKSLNS